MSIVINSKAKYLQSLLTILRDEGFRLFFPLSAFYLAVWPILWVFVHNFNLPFAHSIPPSFWHAHEMIIGGYGAALIGFITTAIPEWTDTTPLRGKPLFLLAGIWGTARIIGLLGADTIAFIATAADLLWIGAITIYIVSVSVKKHTTRLLGFAGWMAALFCAEALARFSFENKNFEFSQMAAHLPGFVFLGLLGLALSRITVPVTNLVLDPTEKTTPFRPHPGRMNLSSGLVAIVIVGELIGLAEPVTAFLMIAAGAAFLDRVGEAFIGREALRAEILVLAGASALAGAGLLMIGAARLGAPFSETSGLHVVFMGGLGMGIMAVFSVAGLLHCGKELRFHLRTKLAFVFLTIGVLLRVLPDLAFFDISTGPLHGLAAAAWSLAFLLWGSVYWPMFCDPETLGERSC